MHSIRANKTWDLIDLPKNLRALPCKWIYRLKEMSDLTTPKYKARLVAKGFRQEYSVDFDEIFSPVVKMTTIHVVVVAADNLELIQLDVKTAFLHGDLKEEIYMEQPKGFMARSAASDAVKEALWLGRLAHTFRQVDSDSTPVVYNDNQGANALSQNPFHHNALKHLDVRYPFVRECVISRKIGLKKISTVDNVTDGMIKCLQANCFQSLPHHMGITRNQFDWVEQ